MELLFPWVSRLSASNTHLVAQGVPSTLSGRTSFTLDLFLPGSCLVCSDCNPNKTVWHSVSAAAAIPPILLWGFVCTQTCQWLWVVLFLVYSFGSPRCLLMIRIQNWCYCKHFIHILSSLQWLCVFVCRTSCRNPTNGRWQCWATTRKTNICSHPIPPSTGVGKTFLHVLSWHRNKKYSL